MQWLYVETHPGVCDQGTKNGAKWEADPERDWSGAFMPPGLGPQRMESVNTTACSAPRWSLDANPSSVSSAPAVHEPY